MRPALIAVVLAGLLTIPLSAAGGPTPEASAGGDGSSGSDVSGTIPVGTGTTLVRDVDHHRHRVPAGVVGLVLEEVRIQTGGSVLFSRLSSCPPGMVCTQATITGATPGPCLGVYAPEGAVATSYAFRWTKERADADVLLEELPTTWGPWMTGPRGAPPYCA